MDAAPSRKTDPARAPAVAGPRDVELRAVFGTDEAFSCRRVAELTAALPAVDACIIAGPGGLWEQAPRGQSGNELAGRSDALRSGIRELTRAIGIPDAAAFTFLTDLGMVSVFVHGDFSLLVRHGRGLFDDGMRERLILITRGIAGLSE